ncbi:protein FAM47E-like [Tiliqua scincoides]|uniref:protein FAM47E-like n=1 Tax=Tiliqua scincoides TaxID=71010 RepID=UPI003462BB71
MPFKYFQKHTRNKSRLSDSLNGQRWRFLQRGSDDFHEGFPPLHDSFSTLRSREPLILPSKPEDSCKRQQKSQKMLPKPLSYTSKLSPIKQARKECIAQVEYCLSQHPLVLYSHLEESVPPELFKEVLGILDPEMLPIREEADDADIEENHRIPSATQSQLGVKRKEQKRAKLFNCKDPKGQDPYTWFSKQKVAAREREARLNYIPPLDENVRQATKEFCSWFDSLGGERYNIDEATIISLFDTGYETKPPLSVPIHVVELDHFPAELRKYIGVQPSQASKESTSWQVGPCKDSQESSQPKWEKIRYGAWYLDPKSWKKQKGNEPLEDPRSVDARSKNSRRALDEKDAEIMQLHGTQAFKEFLDRKGYRIPEEHECLM